MNKYKTLALNTTIFAIGSFGAKLVSFLLNYLYTGAMDTGIYNTKEVVELCANLLIPIVSFSITDAVIRYGLDRNYEKNAVFSNAVTILLGGLGVFVLLSPLLQLYADIKPYWLLLMGYICISCFRQLSTQFARVKGMVKLYAADGIFCILTLFLCNVLFISKLKLGVTGFLLSVMISDLLSGLSVWLIAKHYKEFSFRNIDRELMEVMLRFSLPLIPAAVLWIITGFSDRIFVRHMISDGDAGIYGAAAKIPNLLSMISTVFYQAWNMSAIAENDSKDRAKFYSRIFNAYQALLVLGAGFIIAFVKPLSMLVNNTNRFSSYASAYLYTPLLVIAVMLMCYNQFLSSIYTVSKHTQNSFWTSMIAAVLNLVLNTLLIPRYAVYGAIAATLASYFVCYIIRIFDARRYIPFPVAHWRFALNLLILFAMSHLAMNRLPLLYLWQIIALLLLCALNFRALLDTAKKLLRR
ncbi:MAG: polysaccharide biosynthesis C-terminal domain-containing protein [Oscillospiraceae bacterium]|nr:polysaccharide biosynthesis C-terminal domain-containing protein [Oscillospiraceae bacterium]